MKRSWRSSATTVTPFLVQESTDGAVLTRFLWMARQFVCVGQISIQFKKQNR